MMVLEAQLMLLAVLRVGSGAAVASAVPASSPAPVASRFAGADTSGSLASPCVNANESSGPCESFASSERMVQTVESRRTKQVNLPDLVVPSLAKIANGPIVKIAEGVNLVKDGIQPDRADDKNRTYGRRPDSPKADSGPSLRGAAREASWSQHRGVLPDGQRAWPFFFTSIIYVQPRHSAASSCSRLSVR